MKAKHINEATELKIILKLLSKIEAFTEKNFNKLVSICDLNLRDPLKI